MSNERKRLVQWLDGLEPNVMEGRTSQGNYWIRRAKDGAGYILSRYPYAGDYHGDLYFGTLEAAKLNVEEESRAWRRRKYAERQVLTVREEFAKAAMQARLASNPDIVRHDPEILASFAFRIADAMIARSVEDGEGGGA